MTNKYDLFRAVVPPGCGASFIAEHRGGFAMIEPLSPEALAWLREHTDAEATWLDGRLVVETRYFPALADAIIEAGYLFEGDEPPARSH